MTGRADSSTCFLSVFTAHTTLVVRQTLTLTLTMKIMAGRRGGRRNAGGRGNINLTQAELNALINERVKEVIAAREATRNQNPLNQGDELVHINLVSQSFVSNSTRLPDT